MTRTAQEAGDELYALPPQAFTAARDARVARARIDGDKTLASAVAAFKRPTVAAWLVNLVALSNPGALTALIELGDTIRQAQGNVTPTQLRDLSAGRRKELDSILRRARSLATRLGEPEPSKAQLIEVESTFAAAMADEDSARLVRAGRLLKSLSYSGFGGGFSAAPSGSGATPSPSAGAAPAGTAPSAGASPATASGAASGAATSGRPSSGAAASGAVASGSAASGSAALGSAAKADAQAKARAEDAAAWEARRTEAVNRLAQAQRALAEATGVEAEADQRVRQLTDEIARIRETLEGAQRDARSARQRRLAADRDATSAQRRLARLGP